MPNRALNFRTQRRRRRRGTAALSSRRWRIARWGFQNYGSPTKTRQLSGVSRVLRQSPSRVSASAGHKQPCFDDNPPGHSVSISSGNRGSCERACRSLRRPGQEGLRGGGLVYAVMVSERLSVPPGATAAMPSARTAETLTGPTGRLTGTLDAEMVSSHRLLAIGDGRRHAAH
jgi:hypothetical protein